MDLTNLRLSPTEMDLVTDREWILTKNGIMSKVQLLLAQVSSEQQEHLKQMQAYFPSEIITSTPKISKGENYNGLPYMILDYPRVFDKENIFTIRSLFWWGNFFSITLQLSGTYKQLFTEKIIKSLNYWKENGFSYCINTDPWRHDFDPDNYKAPHPGFEVYLSKQPFIKLAKIFSINDWEKIPASLLEGFRQILLGITNIE
jgi:hypothetical protein